MANSRVTPVDELVSWLEHQAEGCGSLAAAARTQSIIGALSQLYGRSDAGLKIGLTYEEANNAFADDVESLLDQNAATETTGSPAGYPAGSKTVYVLQRQDENGWYDLFEDTDIQEIKEYLFSHEAPDFHEVRVVTRQTKDTIYELTWDEVRDSIA